MKIDIVVHALSGGGAERVAVNLANAWSARGRIVRLILLSRRTPGDYKTDPAIDIVPLEKSKASRSPIEAAFANLNRILGLRAAIRAQRPDLVVGVMAPAAIQISLATLGLNCITIGCEHNNPPFSLTSKPWKLLRSLLYRRLDAVTVLTSGADSWIERHAPAPCVAIIPNAVSWPPVPVQPQLDPAAFVRPGRRTLLSVGRFVPAKGFDHMVQIFARAADEIPDWDLIILGDGPDRDAIAAQVRELGLQDRIRLPGRAGNIADWYANVDMFVMSSRNEGLPMVLLEAMAAGLPVVMWDYDYGPRDVIRDGIDGVITPKDDPELLARAIIDLARDPDRRAALAARAVEVKTRFGEDAILERWDTLIDAVSKRKARVIPGRIG
jgi:glycosyltransferase involved in cell wall biosynthesis